MFSSLAQIILFHSDAALSVAACAIFSRSLLRKRYHWMFLYLWVRAITAVIVEFLFFGPLIASPETYTKAYFVVHWASYSISAILLFMSCLDVYRQALAPLPGLVRMGTTIFRWAAVASVLVTATTFTSVASGPGMLVRLGTLLVRCAGTAELCLLALLLLSMKALKLSTRSRPFGVALGLAMLAGLDCVESSLLVLSPSMQPWIQSAFEGGAVLALAVWIAYSLLPEPATKPVTLPVNSTIYKWDQIASALGHKGTQVVLEPTPSFFLVDVEKVVERAFVRTLKNKESES